MWLHHYLSTKEHPWKILFKQLSGNLLNKFKISEQCRQGPIVPTVGSTYNSLNRKPCDKPIAWQTVAFKEIYMENVKLIYQPYSIETTLKSLNWKGIWSRWAHRPFSNKYKVQMHIVITDHFNKIKYFNKSQNCP